MIGLDTNVLARFITLDEPKQANIVKKLILDNKGKISSMYINNIVLCELCWLLKSGYKYSSLQIYEVLQRLINIEEFHFDDKEILQQAIIMYHKYSGDFADYLIAAHNNKAKCAYTYSFDTRMIKNKIFKALSD